MCIQWKDLDWTDSKMESFLFLLPYTRIELVHYNGFYGSLVMLYHSVLLHCNVLVHCNVLLYIALDQAGL